MTTFIAFKLIPKNFDLLGSISNDTSLELLQKYCIVINRSLAFKKDKKKSVNFKKKYKN